MGQPLPLPEKIPYPSEEIKNSLKNDGIVLLDEKSKKYVHYSLPNGWKMVDDSSKQQFPRFYFIDENEMTQYKIFGTWKGYETDYLEISKVESPLKYVRKTEKVIRSETDNLTMMGTFMEILDPEQRPATQLSSLIDREKDYIPKKL